MVNISEEALTQIRKLQKAEGKENCFLRVGVVGGGCSGLSYKLDFDQTKGEKDKEFQVAEDVTIVIDKKSYLYINGLTLDYSGGLNGTGFGFNNPNAKRTCGCGSSFGV